MGFKDWLEGGFSNDQKATLYNGISVRGSTIGPSKIKNPPDGVRTPTTNSPLALAQKGGISAQNQKSA